jgi:hypothetical protein
MKKIYSITALVFLSMSAFGQFGQISNGDFESWEDQTIYANPTDWQSSNTVEFYGVPAVSQSSDAQDGSYSVQLSSILMGPDTLSGYVFHGIVGQSGPDAGIPYTDNFEAVSFQYKSDLPAGDTMHLIMIRFNAGVMVEFLTVPAAYGTQNVWTPNLLYVGNTVQDSLFIGFSLGNPVNGISVTPGAWALVDNVELISGGVATTPLPNPSFESWTTETVEVASDWYSLNFFLASFGLENANKTTDANTGTYAVEMTTVLNDQDTMPSFLTMGPINLFSLTNPFENAPYNASPTNFSGAYKYAPVNGDQGIITMTFFQAGVPIGMHNEYFTAQGSYTTFNSALTITGIPDSINFLAYSGDNPGSVLKLDDLQFTGGNVGISENLMSDFEMYPNPATEMVTIALPDEGSFTLIVTSMDGKVIMNKSNITGNQLIKLDDFNKGIYIVDIANGQLHKTKKLVVR